VDANGADEEFPGYTERILEYGRRGESGFRESYGDAFRERVDLW
jgi:hypothetical protein